MVRDKHESFICFNEMNLCFLFLFPFIRFLVLTCTRTGLLYGFHCSSVIIVIIAFYAGYGILDGNLRAVPLDVAGSNVTNYDHAWSALTQDPSNTFMLKKLPNQNARTVPALPIELIYVSKSNCLTQSNLASIQALENEITSLPAWQSDLCLLSSTGSCVAPSSILRFFDGTYEAYAGNTFRPDSNFSRIAEIITAAYALNGGVNNLSPNLRQYLNYVLSAGMTRAS